MAGFNLPPGCSVSDLPGNTPADQAAETFSEDLWERLNKLPTFAALPEETREALANEFEQVAIALTVDARRDGYYDAQSDAEQARVCTREWYVICLDDAYEGERQRYVHTNRRRSPLTFDDALHHLQGISPSRKPLILREDEFKRAAWIVDEDPFGQKPVKP